MLKGYLDKRSAEESFHAFCNRHTVGELQVVFDAAV